MMEKKCIINTGCDDPWSYDFLLFLTYEIAFLSKLFVVVVVVNTIKPMGEFKYIRQAKYWLPMAILDARYPQKHPLNK